jgi:predicted dienelactone hydrolase
MLTKSAVLVTGVPPPEASDLAVGCGQQCMFNPIGAAVRLFSTIIAALALCTGTALGANVGFQKLTIPNGQDSPITVGIWYPTDSAPSMTALDTYTQSVATAAPIHGRRLALVVISHGNGSSFAGHYDTALALARNGFVVAALNHTGDTYDDLSRQLRIWARPAQLRRLIDYMLTDWANHSHIDSRRVGAFGFSAGGFTVLAAAGGVPDLTKVAPFCDAHPRAYECLLRKQTSAPPVQVPGSNWFRDGRIKAAVVAAPALGYTFGYSGLEQVQIPIQLWRAQDDHILPHPYYAEAVHIALSRPPEYHVVPNADHFDFLAPCSEQLAKLAPMICSEHAEFDRVAFHSQFNADVVNFFRRTLQQLGARAIHQN